MYLEIVRTLDLGPQTEVYSIQRKDEAGTNIGTADSFSLDTYFIDRNFPTHLSFQRSGIDSSGNFPAFAMYPLDRIILTTTVIPAP